MNIFFSKTPTKRSVHRFILFAMTILMAEYLILWYSYSTHLQVNVYG